MGGVKNAVGLPKKEILMGDIGDKNAIQMMQGVKITIELPKREILMGDIEGKKCSRTAKKGIFDG